MALQKNKPLIKRVTVSEDEDQAPTLGVWKLAYADFVTAMMAFFLLLWLLSSESNNGLKGISEYFNTPTKVALLGGDAPSNVPSQIESRGFNQIPGNTNTKNDLLIRSKIAYDEAKYKEETIRFEAAKGGLEDRLDMKSSDGTGSNLDMSSVQIDVTPDGLHIQISDNQNRPMFRSGSAELMPHMMTVIGELAKVVRPMSNKVSIYGHTDAAPYPSNARGYSNWELSSDRANSTRRELISRGLAEDQIYRVVGYADSRPLLPENKFDSRNRRIEIILMRDSVYEKEMQAESDSMQTQKAVDSRRSMTFDELNIGPADTAN